MKNLILLFSLLLFTTSLQAQDQQHLTHLNDTRENNLVLRAGISFLSVFFKTGSLIDNSELDEDGDGDDDFDETKTPGYGFTTSVGYRWTQFEIGFGSDVYFGRIKDLTFSTDGRSIRGSGHFRVVNLGPTFKYYSPWALFNKATPYFGAGPNWSLQTFVFSDVKAGSGFNNKNRVSFENYGGNVFIGFEEITPFKTDHPTYLEIGYSYMNSYKVSINDATINTDVITLSEKNSRKFSGHYFIVRLGTTLF